MDDLSSFYDKAAHTLTMVGALLGLWAAVKWYRVHTDKETGKGLRLGDAPLLTAAASAAASLGYIIGRFSGAF